MPNNEFTSSMGNSNVISKNLNDFKKSMFGIDIKLESTDKITIIQKEIADLIKINNIYKEKYPSNKVPKSIATIINLNNEKIKQLKEERNLLHKCLNDDLKNKILKNNSPNSDKNESR